MLISTANDLPGYEITEVLGEVFGRQEVIDRMVAEAQEKAGPGPRSVPTAPPSRRAT